jgi:hypothetical protein
MGVVRDPNNNVHVRGRRKRALRVILGGVVQVASYYQMVPEAGWSESYCLTLDEKLWLDPRRVYQVGEEEEASEVSDAYDKREERDWLTSVFHGFGRWVTQQLSQEFTRADLAFGDIESTEWRREIEAAAKASQRTSQRVFQ